MPTSKANATQGTISSMAMAHQTLVSQSRGLCKSHTRKDIFDCDWLALKMAGSVSYDKYYYCHNSAVPINIFKFWTTWNFSLWQWCTVFSEEFQSYCQVNGSYPPYLSYTIPSIIKWWSLLKAFWSKKFPKYCLYMYTDLHHTIQWTDQRQPRSWFDLYTQVKHCTGSYSLVKSWHMIKTS